MALDSSRLATALKPLIEAKVRHYVIADDATAYPKLTEFSQALAEAIAGAVVSEVTTNAVFSVPTWAGGSFAVTGGGGGTVTIPAQNNITGGIT